MAGYHRRESTKRKNLHCIIETGDGDGDGDGDGGIPASPEQLIPFVKECHQGSLCPARSWNINKFIIIITNINIIYSFT